MKGRFFYHIFEGLNLPFSLYLLEGNWCLPSLDELIPVQGIRFLVSINFNLANYDTFF